MRAQSGVASIRLHMHVHVHIKWHVQCTCTSTCTCTCSIQTTVLVLIYKSCSYLVTCYYNVHELTSSLWWRLPLLLPTELQPRNACTTHRPQTFTSENERIIKVIVTNIHVLHVLLTKYDICGHIIITCTLYIGVWRINITKLYCSNSCKYCITIEDKLLNL